MRPIYLTLVLYLFHMTVGSDIANASTCVVNGQLYRLTGETVDWSMKIESGQTCVRDLRFNTALSSAPGQVTIEEVRLLAAPEFGKITAQGAGFSYEAKPNFSGADHFVVVAVGKLNGKLGSSTIRVSVLVGRSSKSSNHGSPSLLKAPTSGIERSRAPEREITFSTLKVGGGGYVTGIQICPNGAMASRANSAYAYLGAVSDGTWSNVLTAATTPKSTWVGGGNGAYEIQLACSNPRIAYAKLNGYLFRTTDGGASWSNMSSWTQAANERNHQSASAFSQAVGPLIAVDPNNPNAALAGNPGTSTGQAMYYTTDGLKWSAISTSSIPQVSNTGFYLVAYDPSSPVSGGLTQGIWVCPHGSQCVHTTGGPSGLWTATLDGPTAVIFLRIDQDGNVFAHNINGGSVDMWEYTNGRWAKVLGGNSGGCGALGVSVTDPNNVSQVWAIDFNGNVTYSSTGGAGPYSGCGTHSVAASDIPWLASTIANQTDMSAAGGAVFDPSGSGFVYIGAGTGVFKAQLPTASVRSANVSWQSVTAAQETLVGTKVVATGRGQVALFAWDRAAFVQSVPTSSYPTTQSAYPQEGILGGWSADSPASSPTTLVMIAANNNGGAGNGLYRDLSGISTNGGLTWTPFGPQVNSRLNSGTGQQTICASGCAALQGNNINVGDIIQIYEQSNLQNWANGTVTRYNSVSGSLTLSINNTSLTNSISDLIVHTIPSEVITGKFGGCIAAADATHFLWLPGQNPAHPWYTINGGNIWNPITIPGLPTSGTIGWGPLAGGGNATCQVAADRVLPDTFYLYNSGSTQPGVYTCTTREILSCSQTYSGQIASGSFYHIQTTPGKSGDIWWSGGDGSSTGNFQHSTNGGVSWNAAMDGSNHIFNVQAFCFGAAFPDESYPSIYLQGNDGSDFGFYMSKDGGSTWTLLAEWPNNDLSLIAGCAGDPVTPGVVYVAFAGSGFAYYALH